MGARLQKRGDKNKVIAGPIFSEDQIPYDYMVVIDSGSKGSRVYVYSWLNSYHALSKGIDLRKTGFQKPKLVKRFKAGEEGDVLSSASESESEFDTEDEVDTSSTEAKGEKEGEGVSLSEVRLPQIFSGSNWHSKIKPGISSFSSSPQKIGKRHMRHLLKLASAVVPKSQHYRTPIFLHSTAGMRLLQPDEQTSILDNICQYVKKKSDFYLPDCKTHINVIDGDTEGIYGWLAINYLIGSFDDASNHVHGKNHTTYGLLDMGGASTQVVFEPNSTEIEEHKNNLFKIRLSELPFFEKEHSKKKASPKEDSKKKDSKKENSRMRYQRMEVSKKGESEKNDFRKKVANGPTSYTKPHYFEHFVYSDSFLGFGIFQAHHKYLRYLTEDYRKKLSENAYFKHPVTDPCLPKGYTTHYVVDEVGIDFIGGSDFQKCLSSIFPVLSNGTHGSNNAGDNGNCKEFSDGDTISSCLLNDLIPAFDFDINHFVGVSGYWDSIRNLLSYQHKIPETSGTKSPRGKTVKTILDDMESNSPESYDYRLIYKQTSKICSKTSNDLLMLNNLKPKENRLSEADLSDLCFKASWILNFLNIGLGFPIFKLDELNKNKKFKSLLLADKLSGSSFSWTYGRALLYANDEFVQAYNNYTVKQIQDKSVVALDRTGVSFTASPNVFHYGSEQKGIPPRPQFIAPTDSDEYEYFDYETGYISDSSESRFYIEPHRWYGFFIFLTLLGMIFWLMIGKSGRQTIYDRSRSKVSGVVRFINRILGKDYIPVSNMIELVDYDSSTFDLEEGVHGGRSNKNKSSDSSEFQIESD